MERGIRQPCPAKSQALGATRSSAKRENVERRRRAGQEGAHHGRGGPGSTGFRPAAVDSGGRRCLTPAAAHDLARRGAGRAQGSSPPLYRGGGGRAWRAQHACGGWWRLG
jgi:hypothetical protein